MSIGFLHAHGGEAGRRCSFGALWADNASTGLAGGDLGGILSCRARYRMATHPLLADARRHDAEVDARGHHPFDCGERDPPLAERDARRLRHPGRGVPFGIVGPDSRKKRPEPDRHGHFAPRQPAIQILPNAARSRRSVYSTESRRDGQSLCIRRSFEEVPIGLLRQIDWGTCRYRRDEHRRNHEPRPATNRVPGGWRRIVTAHKVRPCRHVGLWRSLGEERAMIYRPVTKRGRPI